MFILYLIHHCVLKMLYRTLIVLYVLFTRHTGPAVDHDVYTDCPTEQYKTVQLLTGMVL